MDAARIPATFVERLRSAASVLVTTHRSPDGDAVGSALAASHVLAGMGVSSVVWIPQGVPRPYRFLPGVDSVRTGSDPGGPFGLSLVVDTSDPGLLEVPLPAASVRGDLLVLDHHLTGGGWGDIVVCAEAAATGELVHELAGLLGVPIDLRIATCIYVALVTDTGMFRYDLTTARTHAIAGACLEAGVLPYAVARHVYESYPASYLPLWSELLGTLETSLDGRFATLAAPRDLLLRHGATHDALEEVVTWPRGIEGVEVAALLRYKADGRVRASLRSTGRVNVAVLARRFGGGGHFGAAGCDFTHGLDMEGARALLERELATLLDA